MQLNKITRIINLVMILLGVLFLFPMWGMAQQSIKGRVTEAATQQPLPFANVCLWQDTTLVKCVSSDENGQFKIDNVYPGIYKISVSFIGYQTHIEYGIQVNAGKDRILQFSLQPSAIALESVEVTAERGIQSNDPMAVVSARTFSVEESELYVGSRFDPARMVANYAGVQGADDSRNDIVVRGNSPLGVLWRVEGIPIPNPNHFAVSGSTGGPVTIINNKALANSDFYSGAFPAEFGNAIAAVFDLKLRNGNNEKHEFNTQFGFLGTELAAEGPIKKQKSSYLAAYRYSTLALFSGAGIDIGTNAEIDLGNRQAMFSASSPTGPAFEGGQISAGMRAAPGAIERVRIDPETRIPRFRVIGEEKWSDEWQIGANAPLESQPAHLAAGICGSGIIEAVAELFLAGVINSDGRILPDPDNPYLVWNGRTGAYILATGEQTISGEPILITQEDIRNIQLAKAALYAGAKLLMNRSGSQTIDRIILAGAFGSYIDPKHAMILGLIPDCDLERVYAVGNAAGDGARIALLDRNKRREAQQIARWIKYIETAVDPDFQREFVDAMYIPHRRDPFPHLAGILPVNRDESNTRLERRRRSIRGQSASP